MALIVGCRKIFAELRLGKPQSYSPKQIQPRHLPTFIRVPFKNSGQAKALGAKWDREHKSYYIPQKKDPTLFEQWAISLPKAQKTHYRQNRARDMGAIKEDSIGLDDL
ncbi:MAG: hypothetical protein HRT36_02085 [Alphaproteobacteria bacterium]|nr:hypothetical protein [Alphaproteobacteria bacterium]